MLVSGWQTLALVSASDGETVSLLKLPCHPTAPPLVADFNSDGVNDIVVTCAERYQWNLCIQKMYSSSLHSYLGFSLQRHSGFWQSTVLSLFVGMVIVVIAIYTRQKNVGLLPAVKTAQD